MPTSKTSIGLSALKWSRASTENGDVEEEKAQAVSIAMPRRLTITFPADREYGYYTRVFYFAESLQGRIIQSGLGTMNDVDTAREAFWIQLSDSHDLGKVKKIVRQALAKFSLTGDAMINTG